MTSPDIGPAAGPYSPAVRVGDLLFVSGQGPFRPDGTMVGPAFRSQADAVFDNIAALAAAAGTTLAHTVRIGCYLSSLDHFTEWNAVCAERLTAPHPARTTVPVALPGFDIEVDAVLWIPPAAPDTPDDAR
ncbi:RidA family protein [Dactylosporangium fulvum]|uniref:RidA family protein n=1 Tax=Dactylosporangium fulvum TaxID=53359 RepID=A0ABY5VMP4_9ACTN|nr:RidA family protein [Dactylosporangium fulvum]UWP78977.1 RidA family protein [Dactylosporangium fulvum]